MKAMLRADVMLGEKSNAVGKCGGEIGRKIGEEGEIEGERRRKPCEKDGKWTLRKRENCRSIANLKKSKLDAICADSLTMRLPYCKLWKFQCEYPSNIRT